MQATLFDSPPHPRWRHSDPATSVEAGKSLTPGRTERALLDVMHTEPQWSWTADQLSARLPLVRQDTLRSALSRPKKQGLIVPSGRGPSNAGRSMTSWRLA